MPIPLLQTTFDGLYLNSRTFLFGKMMEWVGIFFVVSLRHKHNQTAKAAKGGAVVYIIQIL